MTPWDIIKTSSSVLRKGTMTLRVVITVHLIDAAPGGTMVIIIIIASVVTSTDPYLGATRIISAPTGIIFLRKFISCIPISKYALCELTPTLIIY